MVGASDTSNFVFVEHSFDSPFGCLVEFHEDDVWCVDAQEYDWLVPCDLLVDEEKDEGDERNAGKNTSKNIASAHQYVKRVCPLTRFAHFGLKFIIT